MQEITLKNASPNYIASVVCDTCKSCYGVVGLASPNGLKLIDHILPPFFNRNGVEVLKSANGYKINVYIVVEYGNSFSAVSKNLCDAIRYNLYNECGVKTDGIKIHIKGVRKSEL